MLRDSKSSIINASKVRAKTIYADKVQINPDSSLVSNIVTKTGSETLTNKTFTSAANSLYVDGADISGDLDVDSLVVSGDATISGSVVADNVPTGNVETFTTTAQTIAVDTSFVIMNVGSACTVLLPALADAIMPMLVIKKMDAAFVITVTADGTETFADTGASTFPNLDAQYDSVILVPGATAWYVAASAIA